MESPPRVRLTIVTAHFHPDVAATGQLLTELATGLVEMGCDVSIFTTHPTFGPRGHTPAFEIYQGVRVHRVFSTRLDKNSRVGRALNAGSFFLSVLSALLVSRGRGPLMIVSNPPFLAFAGVIVKKLRGRSFLYLVHDVFPDLAVVLGYVAPNSWVRRLWDAVNRVILRHASGVIVLGESMKQIMIRKAGANASFRDQVRVIHNWADGEFIRPLPRDQNLFARQQGIEDEFVVLYSGNMGLGHNLEMVIDAAGRLRHRRMLFLFIGDGGKRRKLESLVSERRLDNVRFLPYQPRELLPYSLTSGNVSLVALEKGIEGIQMPSKLYTILAAGCPAVGLLEPGSEIARIIHDSGCGASVAPGDVDGLVRVLERYDLDRDACVREGRAGRSYFEAHFTRTRACREYFDVVRAMQ